jgi:hypothetical protein
MIRTFIALALFACIATSCGTNSSIQNLNTNDSGRSVSTVDATNAWNSVCAQYHFIPKPADARITFAQGYSGSNFVIDFTLITVRVNSMLGILNASAPTDGNDVMKYRIENWGPLGGLIGH